MLNIRSRSRIIQSNCVMRLLITVSLVIVLCLYSPVSIVLAKNSDSVSDRGIDSTDTSATSSSMESPPATESESVTEEAIDVPTSETDPATGFTIDASEFLVIATSRGVSLLSHTIPDRRSIPAASKLMTAVIALEALPSDEDIPVTKKALDIDKKSPSPISLKIDQKYTVKFLVSAIILRNSDAAAFMLAEYISENEVDFVERMNETAKNLSMNDTNFVNTSGLSVLQGIPGDVDAVFSSEQYSTASDLAILFRYALNLSAFREIFTEYSFLQFQEDGKPLTLSSSVLSAWGIEEIKGASLFTPSFSDSVSESCLFALAQKGDLEVILLTTGIPDQSSYQTLHDLVDVTFSSFEVSPLIEAGDPYREVNVAGVTNPVNAVFRATVLYAHPIGQSFSIPVSEFIPSVFTTLPIKKGDVLGQVRLTLEDGTQVTTEVVASDNMVVNENFFTSTAKLIESNRNIGYLIAACILGLFFLAIRVVIRFFTGKRKSYDRK